jgi:L-arabinokinase
MHGGFGGFRQVRDLPFVARHSRRDRAHLRGALGLRADATTVLVSFGGFGLDTDGIASLRDLADCDILMADSSVVSGATRSASGRTVARDGNLLTIDEHAWYRSGYRYEDLVHAADVVVTKPGYGIIAECLANDTAIVYTSRGEFAEYDVLVEALQRHARAAFVSNADLRSGHWAHAIRAAVAQPPPAARVDTNGAAIAAAWAVARL